MAVLSFRDSWFAASLKAKSLLMFMMSHSSQKERKNKSIDWSSLDLKLRYNFQQYSFVICPRDLFLTTIMPSWCCLIPCELSVWWASWHGGWNYKATQETQTIHGGSHVWWFRCHYFMHEMQIWLSKASSILMILLCRCSSFDTNISNAFLLPAYFL